MTDPLVAVTGADGFIGAAYGRRLAERGRPVRRIVHARPAGDSRTGVVALDLEHAHADALTHALDGAFDLILFLGVLYHVEDVFGCMRRLRDLLAPAGIVALETQMTNIASDLPIFECASDTYKTTVQQGKNSLGGVGISNFLLPNDAAIRNLADSFDFACEALDSPRNVYSAELPGRRLYRLVRG